MKKIIHKANDRGVAEYSWLHSKHSFSFAHFYNPDKTGFGLLRVLNDDIVEAGKGFSTHSHDNMEIISIVLDGALEHKDSMGSTTIIFRDDVQVMQELLTQNTITQKQIRLIFFNCGYYRKNKT